MSHFQCSINSVLIKMKIKVETLKGTNRVLNIEVSGEELKQKFDQVYRDIGRVARVSGYRPGHVPRDLLQVHYGEKAREEVIKRGIPEYYLAAVRQEKLIPVAAPEIEDVQFKNHTLYFKARIDIRPEVKIKAYKNLRIIKKKVKVEPKQVDEILQRLQESRAKSAKGAEKKDEEKPKPELNDAFAKDLGFATLEELKEAIGKDLEVNAEAKTKADMERQILEQLLKKASLDVPESLVKRQIQEAISQLKMNRALQGGKKEDLDSKTKELEDKARDEAIRRVKLGFILSEVGERENIQLSEEDLDKRIEAISQRLGKPKDEVRRYLETENLTSGLKAELKDRKTMELLLREAKVSEA